VDRESNNFTHPTHKLTSPLHAHDKSRFENAALGRQLLLDLLDFRGS
jgi:hypothetical protein